MKADVPYHSKTMRLMRALRVPRWQAVGVLEMLWHATRRETPCGDIGKLSNEDIAASMEYLGDENELVAALIKTGWIDEHEKYRLVIHDWSQHCDLWVHAQVARMQMWFTDGIAPKLNNLASNLRAKAAAFYGLNLRQLEEQIEDPQMDLPITAQPETSGLARSGSPTIVNQGTSIGPPVDVHGTSTGPPQEPILSYPIRSGVSGGVEGSRFPLPPRASSPPLEKPEKANTAPNRRRIGFESAAEIAARASPLPLPSADVELAGRMLSIYVEDVAREHWGEPDAKLAGSVLRCFDGSIDGLRDWLRVLREFKRKPGHSWGWFLTLAQDRRAHGRGGGDASLRSVQ